jgi:hypothetical protein
MIPGADIFTNPIYYHWTTLLDIRTSIPVPEKTTLSEFSKRDPGGEQTIHTSTKVNQKKLKESKKEVKARRFFFSL